MAIGAVIFQAYRALRRSAAHAPRLTPIAVLVLLALVPSGCALRLFTPQTTISGHVYGDPLASAAGTAPAATPTAAATPPATATPSPLALAGLAPVRATVACNDVTATAGPDGAYQLAVDQASQYVCTISAPPNYVSATATINGQAGRSVRLDLGDPSIRAGASSGQPNCDKVATSTTVVCAPLHLRPGTLAGVVTSADTGQPVANATLSCWRAAPAGSAPGTTPPLLSATSDATGAFTLRSVPPGAYSCAVSGDPTLQQTVVAPGGSGTLNIAICGRSCPPVRFHGDVVMHTLTAYLIFWLPGGHTFEPGGSDKRFEALIGQYIGDVGGTPFYGLLSQYWDYQGAVVNSVTLGASSVDTAPYPHAGTRGDPVSADDIEGEVERVRAANKWTADSEHMIFVFTGYNVESCVPARSGTECSFGNNGRHYCAYHSDFPGFAGRVIYAYLPVLSDCSQLPELSTYGSPNHDVIADATINSMSHEHFEAVTDPFGRSWFDGDPSRGEIGDKCEYRFGAVRGDGSNITLNHGHAYLLQEEWSNRAGRCALE
jgi:hypothetical protein